MSNRLLKYFSRRDVTQDRFKIRGISATMNRYERNHDSVVAPRRPTSEFFDNLSMPYPKRYRLLNNLAEEQYRTFMLRIVEESLGGALLDDLAIVHEDYPVGCLAGETHLMGNDDHCRAFRCQLLH